MGRAPICCRPHPWLRALALCLSVLAGPAALAQEEAEAGPPAGMGSDFEQIMEEIYTLTPDELSALQRWQDDYARAQARPPASMPKPVSGYQLIDISPGAPPAVLRVHPGIATSLSFFDRHGAPWPLEGYKNNADGIDVELFPRENSNVLDISAGRYTTGSINVYLRGLLPPVPIMMVSGDGQTEVDTRMDFRIDARLSPDPDASQGPPVPYNNGRDQLLLDVLVGLKPAPAAQRRWLREAPNALVWDVAGRRYVRTTYEIIYPAPLAMERSSDGTFAYALPAAPSYFGLGQDGTRTTLTILDSLREQATVAEAGG